MSKRIYTLLGVSLASLGIVFLLLAATLLTMVPLSSGFTERSAKAAIIGVLASSLGIGLTLRQTKKDRHPTRTSLIFGILLPGIVGWLIFATIIYALQDDLLFSPRTLSLDRATTVSQQFPQAQEVYIKSDAATLHGWFLPASNSKPAPLIILFYGQGGEASRYLRMAEKIPEASWAFINYRGYGWSTGTPSQDAIFSDGVTIYDHFAQHPLVDEGRIIALAGSLGTGPAVYLAANRPLAAVLLFSPYDSIAGGVAQDLIPFVPTKVLLRNSFNVMEYAQAAQSPLLAVIGDADQVIKPVRSYTLVENWAHTALQRVVPGGTHYSIYEDDETWEAIRDFLLKLAITTTN